MKQSFLKLGSKVFNPAHIVSINLDFCDDNVRGVSISLSNGEFYLFEKEEAEILRRFLMLGSLTIDLNNLYGQAGGRQC